MDIPPDLSQRVLALEKQFKNVPSPLLSLFAMLPEPGKEWPTDDRATFLRALAATCDLVYGEDAHISVEAEARLSTINP